jgi:hypothetical protein
VTVADEDHTGFCAVDVTDPTAPRITAEMIPPGFPVGVIARGEYAFVNCLHAGLQVAHVANPMEPFEAGHLLERATVRDLVVSGDIAYLLVRESLESTFHTVSLTDPADPEILGSVPIYHHVHELALHGPYAFVSTGAHGLVVIDIRNPAVPTIVSELEIDGSAIYMEQAGDHVYLGVLGTMDTYLIVIDVTDPDDPVQVAELVLASTPHGIARSGNYLFVSEHEDGADRYVTEIVVIDIRDPGSPFPAAGYFMDSVFAGDLRVDGNVLYASFWTPAGSGSSGFELLDISDPLAIQPLGAYANAGGFGSGVCLAGDIAYFAGDTRRLDVLDVSDPGSPTLIHSVPTTFALGCFDRAGDHLFCGASYGGLNSLRVFDRLVNRSADVARSLPLPMSGADLSRIRLEVVQEPSSAWEISADGGLNWQAVPADGSWCDLEHSGPELLWRTTLLYTEPGAPPAVDRLELEWTYGTTAVPGTTPGRLALHQNVPNPFNPTTWIDFELPEAGAVALEITDVNGRQVTTLVDGELAAGSHQVTWEGRDAAGSRVASGIYLYRLTTPSSSQTRKMLLLE